MAFSSEEESHQRKANFFAAHDIIEEHNKKSNKTYKLEHNKFSLLVKSLKLIDLADQYDSDMIPINLEWRWEKSLSWR